MGDPLTAQYDSFPYPARDPADEAKRLVEGSPSAVPEIDHYVFAGARDWRQPFRALVAGGGTGDGLVQLAAGLAAIRCPAEVVYLDASRAARGIAEARVAARGLANVRFVTGDLLSAPDLGPFDYIDCCGVLHHLPDPQAGLAALATALCPAGGMGIMVYGRIGRTGVYDMQDALRLMAREAPLEAQVRLARTVLDGLPETNWLRRNPAIGDHRVSDAGLVDLLLNARDRAYDIEDVFALAATCGLSVASLIEPVRYEPAFYLSAQMARDADLRARIAALGRVEQARVAERLAGNLKVHVAYLVPGGRAASAVARPGPGMVPIAHRIDLAALAGLVAAGKPVPITMDGFSTALSLPREAAPLLKLIDGRQTLADIQRQLGVSDPIVFSRRFGGVFQVLNGINKLLLRCGD